MTTTLDPAITERGRVGVLQASALYVAAVLGTGILVLPGLAASAAGPASILSVAAVLVLSIPLAGTFAALAARYPDAGGVATFVRLALGATAARMAGYWFFFGVAVGGPVVATLGGEYLVAVAGGPRWMVTLVAVLIYLPPFAATAIGIRIAGWVQLVLTGALILVVILVVAIAVPSAKSSNFQPFLPHGWGGVGAAISLFVWAFAGWEAVTHIAAEFKNPRRTIPVATAIAIVTVGVAYLTLQLITVAVLGTSAGSSAVPLLALVTQGSGGIGPGVVAAISFIVAVGVLNAYLPAFANLGASLGRDGHLPKWIARGADAGEVPRRALVVVGAINVIYFAVLVLRDFDLKPFILVHTSSMVAVYLLGMIAAVRLLHRWSAGWWMAVVSVILVAGLLVLAGPNLFVPALLVVAAVVVTLVSRVRRNQSKEPVNS
ncbi:MAG: amino acid permease-associated protein [Glaciihabitans sp.]|nr:amino acid permease-associated protein [Glaciihabitans sp.]